MLYRAVESVGRLVGGYLTMAERLTCRPSAIRGCSSYTPLIPRRDLTHTSTLLNSQLSTHPSSHRSIHTSTLPLPLPQTSKNNRPPQSSTFNLVIQPTNHPLPIPAPKINTTNPATSTNHKVAHPLPYLKQPPSSLFSSLLPRTAHPAAD